MRRDARSDPTDGAEDWRSADILISGKSGAKCNGAVTITTRSGAEVRLSASGSN